MDYGISRTVRKVCPIYNQNPTPQTCYICDCSIIMKNCANIYGKCVCKRCITEDDLYDGINAIYEGNNEVTFEKYEELKEEMWNWYEFQRVSKNGGPYGYWIDLFGYIEDLIEDRRTAVKKTI